MFKLLYRSIRKIVFSILFIYAYNRLSSPINIYIPFNFYTVGLMSLFGAPSLIMFILYSFIYI